MNVRNHLLMKSANIVIHHGESTFPTTPALGTMAMVDGILYIWSTINGLNTWTPLTNRTIHFTYHKAVVTNSWVINHDMGTQDLIFFVYDENDDRHEPSAITFTDDNNIILSFLEDIKGRCVIFAAVDEVGITISNMFDMVGDDIIFKGNLIPESDDTWSIGSSTNKIKDLYISASTIYVGSTEFSGTNITAAGTHMDCASIETTADVVVGGDLTVNGAMTTVSSTDLEITDNTIIVNKGEVGSGVSHASGQAGMVVDRGGSTDASIAWNEGDDKWVAGLVGSETALSVEGHGHAIADVTGLQTAIDAATHELPIWTEKTSANNDDVLVNGDNIAADTTTAAFTLILPSSAVTGWAISIVDSYSQFNTNNLTIQRAGTGENIMGAADNLTLDVDNYKVTLTYLNVARGWILT